MIETVPADGDQTVTARGGLSHLCPFKWTDDDHGSVDIVWRVKGKSIELHSLRDYLDSFADARISHEDLTEQIREDLSALPGVTVLTVTTYWDTAGMEVVCATSPTPPPD